MDVYDVLLVICLNLWVLIARIATRSLKMKMENPKDELEAENSLGIDSVYFNKLRSIIGYRSQAVLVISISGVDCNLPEEILSESANKIMHHLPAYAFDMKDPRISDDGVTMSVLSNFIVIKEENKK
jgi:hypothetical protein